MYRNSRKKRPLTSGTVVWYGVLINTGALSFTSETRTIIGMFRLRRVDRIVHEIYTENKKKSVYR